MIEIKMISTRDLVFSVILILLFALPAVAGVVPINPAKAKLDEDGSIAWYDGRDIGIGGKGWAKTSAPYSRLPETAEGKVTIPDWGLSNLSAGLFLRFNTSSPSFKVRWSLIHKELDMPHMPATGVSGVDLYAKDANGQWRFVANGRPTGSKNTVDFPGGPDREYLLYLPLYNGVVSLEVGIPKDQRLAMSEAPARPTRPIVWYGHSITQGGCASRPGMACTNLVSRALDREIINLGFSGSGTMDEGMAGVLAELDPAVFVLDCGANMTAEQITARVGPFVRILRAAHPDTPILLVEEYHYLNLKTLKGELQKQEYDKLKAAGDTDLHWLPAAGMLGEDGDGTVDGVHPNDVGMVRQAKTFGNALSEILKSGTK